MKNKWLLLFVLDAALHLLTTWVELPLLNHITKPLLMVFLAGYFISQSNTQHSVWVLLALIFSWLGDGFLMYQHVKPIYFMLGLGSFLLAHVSYMVRFSFFKTVVPIKLALIGVGVCILYGGVLLMQLWPGLGGLKLPVVSYAWVLMAMGSMAFLKTWRSQSIITLGALLFIISDSLIAYDKFVQPITASRFLIMSTYIAAQFLLIQGLRES